MSKYILAIFFLVSLKTYALPISYSNLPTCSVVLAKFARTGEGLEAEKNILKYFKNDDGFAQWFLSQGYNVADIEELEAQYLQDVVEVMRESDPDSKIQSAQLVPRPAQVLINRFNSKSGSDPNVTLSTKVVDFRRLDKETESFYASRERTYYTSSEKIPSNPYEIVVSSLRKGDTLIFEDGTYKLGDFLGAGNATHIFALANDLKTVIRIPFLAGFLSKDRSAIDQVKTTVKKQPQSERGRVIIKHVGEGFKYLLVTRINGKETGPTFIHSLPENLESIRSWLYERSLIRSPQINYLFFNPSPFRKWKDDQFVKIQNYLAVKIPEIRAASDVKLISDPIMKMKYKKLIAALKRFPQNEKQFIWDEIMQDWILADWE